MLISKMLIAASQEIWDKYLEHPFIVEMAQGTLPINKFRKYMLQDYLYLEDYLKVFSEILNKARTMQEIAFIAENIKAVVDETLRVHIPYMKYIGVKQEDIIGEKREVENLGYTHYMYTVAARESFVEGLIAILACSWSYAYIAENMIEKYPKVLNHKLYGDWFKSYYGEEYQKTNKDLIEYVEDITANYSEEEKINCVEIFKNCSIFELKFWDMAYNK